MLTKEEFWSIVNKAVDLSNGDKGLQTALMVQGLLGYDDISIVGFRFISDKFIDEINTQTLHLAEYIIRGGCFSDDPHYYFLNWVVSLGEVAYNEILENPDSIIDHLPPIITLPFGYEELEYEDMYCVPFAAIELKYQDIKTENEIWEICENAGDEAWSKNQFVWKGIQHDGISNIDAIRQKLPRLCELYEKDKSLEELFEFYFKD